MGKPRKRRGHWCWMCGRLQANENFSGRNHERHLCRKCARKPKEERERERIAQDLSQILRQRHISAKNIAWLEKVCQFPDAAVAFDAALVLQVARLRPYKRRRNGFLAHNHRELYRELVNRGLIDAPWWPCYDEDYDERFLADLVDIEDEEELGPEIDLDTAVAEWSETLHADGEAQG